MNTKVNWKGKLSFVGTANTGFEVPLGANPNVGGDNDGFRPLEMMTVSLAGCTAMDVISILQKKREEITDFRVEVNANRVDKHPKVISDAVVEYHVTGKDVNEKAVVRAIELSATRYCPAQSMLVQVFPMELKYFIYGENGDLVLSGIYDPSDQ